MRKVSIICTGGTLSMVHDENGALAPAASDKFKEILHREVPELQSDDMPTFETTIYDPLLDSSQMTVADWNKIAKDIYDQYDNYDGFVILHGTDTMAYTGSALSFMLQNLSKPVILTGAQIPLSSPNNDAKGNITQSIRIAGNCPQINEVCIYFDGDLLRANRAVKTSTTSLKAFTSPNYPPLGKIDENNNIQLCTELLRQNHSNEKLELTPLPITTKKIRFFRVEPSFDVDLLEQTLTGADAVILQTLGDGNMPINGEIIGLLAKANEAGVILINRSQCLQSDTASGTYAPGAALAACNIISAGAQTNETIRAKLLYLFTRKLSPEAMRGLFVCDRSGELTPAASLHYGISPDRHSRYSKRISPGFFHCISETPNTSGSNALTHSDDTAPSPFSAGDPTFPVSSFTFGQLH